MYVVPGMKLIPQKNDTSCWFASVWMLINWKREQLSKTLAANPDPSQVRQTVAWEVAGNGLVNPDVLRMARLLGLKSVPPMSPSLDLLERLLQRYGPLWTNGKGHIVVIAGIDQGAAKVLVYDPWPPNAGKVEWRSFADWYLGRVPPGANDPDSSRDTGPDVEAVFLYHP